MYPTPMYRAAISRTALPTALAGMTPPVCAARAGVGAGGGGGGSAVTVIATVSKVQVAPAGTCTTGAVVRAIRADAVSALVSTAGTVECSTGVSATAAPLRIETRRPEVPAATTVRRPASLSCRCLLYTSDAADEEDSVDLGGRRIIKKKK